MSSSRAKSEAANKAKAREKASRRIRRLRGARDEGFATGEPDRLDAAGFALLLLTVLLTALPALAEFGGRGDTAGRHGEILGATGGTRLLEMCALMTAAAAFLSRSAATAFRTAAIPRMAFAGVVLLGVVQVVPLPYKLLQISAPVNATIYHDARETLALFGQSPPFPRISIAPEATTDALFGLAAAGALAAAAAHLVRSRFRRRLFSAAAGLAAIAAAAPAILGAVRPEHGDAAAAHLEIALALAFAYVWSEVLVGPVAPPGSLDSPDRMERRILPMAGRLAVWLALGAAVVATRSPFGIAAALATGVLLPLAAAGHPRGRRRWKAAVGLSLGAAAAGIGLVFALMGGFPSDASRPAPFASADAPGVSIAAWKEFPVFGSGLGTFAEAAARVGHDASPRREREPENDALGILVTGGAIGGALAAALAVSTVFVLGRAWLRQKHREESAYALAGIGAFVSLCAHAFGAPIFESAGAPLCLAAVVGASWAAALAGSSRG